MEITALSKVSSIDHSVIITFIGETGVAGDTASLPADIASALTSAVERKQVATKLGKTTTLVLGDKTVIVVGSGEDEKRDLGAFDKAIKAGAQALEATEAQQAAAIIDGLTVSEKSINELTQRAATEFVRASYRYTETKSEAKPAHLQSLAIVGDQDAIASGTAIAEGINYTRLLADLPANIATPAYLAEQAQALDSEFASISTKVIDEAELEEMGAGAFVSVSKGSTEPGKLIAMEYFGANKEDAPYVFVGKGITFDTGGISLKPGAGMDEMKYDMGGAASVFGMMKTIALLEPNVNVVGVVAAAENMPAGNASKPGDVVTSLSGKTIEILNTDAEGRLVLCDALTWSINEYKPNTILDIATLTGACMMALGGINSGLMTENDELAEAILESGKVTNDRFWRLPLEKEYQELIDSPFADMQNIGGRLAGATTAACFLSRFTDGQRWAHLDIAGSAWQSSPKGATGRPVATLVNFLLTDSSK